ncbi:MAG: hypothetical protein P4L66_15865 [Acetobacteraceae bacterium]|nr:hypothetical protein [Acetobacteraceae bacterium]
MSSDLTGCVRPRPIRVAFLVQEGKHAQLALDGIFADCYYRWGGRFSLIVPCDERRISQAYWPWLEAYDADIVYSYVPLDAEAILEIHERLSPSLYRFHELGREPRLDVHGFKPSYDFEPLSSMSTIFRIARYQPQSLGSPIKIIDSWPTERPSRFLSDNFGTYHVSRGGGIFPVDATPAASLMTIVSPDKQTGRRYDVPQNLDTIPDEATAFRHFAEGRAASLSLASTILAPKLDIQHGRWTSSFNLVVGDSFEDRLIFWNGRLFIPGWLDADLCCARVTLADLRNDIFLATLGELIKRRNHVNGGSGGQPQLTIRSASLTAVELEEAQTLLMSTKPWSVITTESVPTVDALVPPERALTEARESDHFSGSMTSQSDRRTFNWSPPFAKPPPATPDHLNDAPSRQTFTQGYWAADVTLEHGGAYSRLARGNRWMLPRRWRVASSFKVKRTSGRNEPPAGARRSRDGNLSVFVGADHPVESITVPSAADAVRGALAIEGRWAKQAAKHGEVLPENKVVWARPSNEARYLAGVLGMTGGLSLAREALLHPFLQEKFAQLGGSPNVMADRVTPTVARLKKKARRNPSFDLTDELDTRALAELIVSAARALKNPLQFVKYEDLKRDWKAYRDDYWTRHPKPQSSEPDYDWDKHEEASLDRALIEMRRRQMLFQGHRWVCDICHHRNWVDLAALSSELSCEVCKRVEQTPVDVRWLFRPNEFLIESLRDHSVLSLIWVLAALCDRARHSFIFVEPTCFGYTDDANPSAEIDLMAIVDGRAMLCEIKSSWHFRPIELADFVALAIRLRPDVALWAVMDDGPGPSASLDRARSELEPHGITFEVLTPNAVRSRDDVYLNLGS